MKKHPTAAPRLGQMLYGLIFLPLLGWRLYDGEAAFKRFAPPEQPPAREVLAEHPVSDPEWEEMVKALEAQADRYRGEVGIYIKDLGTGRVWEHNGDKLFTAASLIKVPIMASVCELIKEGGLSLETRLKLTRRDKTGGSGSLRRLRSGTNLRVMELVHKMITESDNTATRMLLDHVGIDYFQRAFAALGLVYTRIYPEGMSLSSDPVARENYTTAREMAMLLERIYDGEVVDRASSEYMMEVLKQNHGGTTRMRKALPRGWELGHKTGMLRRSCHDVGIVFSPRGDYVLAVLTGDVPDYYSARNFIARVSNQTYRYYKTGRRAAPAGKAKSRAG